MTCIDCIHYEVCEDIDDGIQMCYTGYKGCEYFKPKSRYIALPCAVGDMVYQIKYCRCGNPECYEMKHCYKKDTKRTPKVIDSIMLLQKGKRLTAPYKFEWKPIGTICYKIIQKPFKLEWLTEFGKTVFLAKEEAEKALKEREKQK